MTAKAPPGKTLRIVLIAGTIAALIEMVPVLGIQAGALGVPPARVFQAIASGLLGRAAFFTGAWGVLLGVAIHWLISAGAVLIFLWTARRWSDLWRHNVLAGLGYGVLSYAVMTALVVPFSFAAFGPNTNKGLMLVSLAIHIFFFGLPIAIAARRLEQR